MRSSALSWAGIVVAVAVLAGCSAPVPAAPDPDPATPAEATVPSQEPVSGEQPDEPSAPGTAEGDSGSPGQSGAPDAPQGPADSGSEHDSGPEQSPPSSPPSPPSTSEPDAGDDDEPGSSPPAAEGPVVAITSMSCNGSGDYQTLRVQLTASYNTKYRKGITWVRLTREDNRGTSWISQTDADWAGQYAGKGDRWSGELPSRTPSKDNYGYGQDYGKTLKLRVRTDDGTIWEQLHPIDRNC